MKVLYSVASRYWSNKSLRCLYWEYKTLMFIIIVKQKSKSSPKSFNSFCAPGGLCEVKKTILLDLVNIQFVQVCRKIKNSSFNFPGRLSIKVFSVCKMQTLKIYLWTLTSKFLSVKLEQGYISRTIRALQQQGWDTATQAQLQGLEIVSLKQKISWNGPINFIYWQYQIRSILLLFLDQNPHYNWLQ